MKSSRIFFPVIVIVFIINGCVPTKKLAYLQGEGGLKADHAYDSAIASYHLKKEPYRLKPGDIISIRVASITDTEYNFLKKYEEELGLIRKLDQYSQGAGRNGNNGNQQFRGGGFFGGGGGGGDNDEYVGFNPILLDRMNTGFALDMTGSLELPELGVLELVDLTIPEAEMKIRSLLDGYYETPMVRVQLLNYHFTIVGEIGNEGRYTSFDPEINIFDAIILAGNLTEFADRANLKIVRTEGNESKVYYINTLDETTLNANNFYIRRGDLIIVPALNARTSNRYTIPNLTRALGIVSTALSLTALIISLTR
ncbi:MAG: polysaccharide biosynthesis/export family protein [Bacteroidota bacterium]